MLHAFVCEQSPLLTSPHDKQSRPQVLKSSSDQLQLLHRYSRHQTALST